MNGQFQWCAAAQPGGVVVDLDGIGAGQEFAVGKVGAEHQDQFGLVHRLIAGAVAEQSAHAHVVGIVELNPFLAAQAVPDGRVQQFGEAHHLLVRVAHPGTAEESDRSGRVQGIGECLYLFRCGHHPAEFGDHIRLARRMRRLQLGDVTGQYDH